MTETEKIQILLKEYETLRAEVVQRFNHRFHFLTIIGGLGAFIFFKADKISYLQISAVVLAAISVIVVWFWIGDVIARCSRRISELERKINEIAGEDLLMWETIQLDQGIFHKIHKITQSCQQSGRGAAEDRAPHP
jgi:hypothetical protein